MLSQSIENLVFSYEKQAFRYLGLSEVLSKSFENLIFPWENQAFCYLGLARAAQPVPLGLAPLR